MQRTFTALAGTLLMVALSGPSRAFSDFGMSPGVPPPVAVDFGERLDRQLPLAAATPGIALATGVAVPDSAGERLAAPDDAPPQSERERVYQRYFNRHFLAYPDHHGGLPFFDPE